MVEAMRMGRSGSAEGRLPLVGASRRLNLSIATPLAALPRPPTTRNFAQPLITRKQTSSFRTSGGTGRVDVLVNDFFRNVNADRLCWPPTVPRLLVGICAVEAGKEQRDAGILPRRRASASGGRSNPTRLDYAKKSDCFRRAASMLQTRCGDLETDENARVRAAITMTLCEIATGDHASPPLECEPFQFDSNAPYETQLETGRKCVSALSRSAQYWSSYSGYLREVTHLCYAYQRWNDIDTAKEAHKNTTREAMNVLRYLTDREKRMEQTHEDTRSIVVSMQAVLEQMLVSTSTLDIASAALSSTLRQVLDEVSERFLAVILETEQRAVDDHRDTLSRMDANISQALDGFSVAMENLFTDLQQTVTYHLGSAFSQIESNLQNFALLVDRSSSKFAVLEKAFGELHHATVLLIMDTRQAGADVDAHLRTSHMVLEKQLAIAAISDDVASTLSELVIKAQGGMQDLNMTVAEIQDSLSKKTHDDWTTAAWFWFQETMLHVLQVHPASFQHPVFLAIYHGFRIFRVLSLCFSSGLMGLFVLLVSIGNLLSRYLWGRGRRSNQLGASVISEAPRAQTTTSSSRATERLSLDSDFARSGRSRGLSPEAYHARTVVATSARRRTRLSRIPERLLGRYST